MLADVGWLVTPSTSAPILLLRPKEVGHSTGIVIEVGEEVARQKKKDPEKKKRETRGGILIPRYLVPDKTKSELLLFLLASSWKLGGCA